jgi:phytoene dehydrogenase-like protein
MSAPVVVIGAGTGGLTAAIRLARLGHTVEVYEARSEAGGLASSVRAGEFEFDAGPYVLLDRPGLEWAFEEIGCDLSRAIDLARIEDVYEVALDDGEPIRFHSDLDRTAAGIDRRWSGSGRKYVAFVERMRAAYEHARPLLFTARPRLGTLLRTGAWREIPLLLRGLEDVLGASDLPREAADAIAIWTFVAGQSPRDAPSPMAFIPALIHTSGAWYPREGIRRIPRALMEEAVRAGVAFHFGAAIERIRHMNGRVEGVETASGERISAAAVVSNYSGVGTYLELCDGVPQEAHGELARLELQSPGFCAYLRARTDPRPPYLRFRRSSCDARCRLLVSPGAIDRSTARDGWWPLRLISPIAHAEAQAMDLDAQLRSFERLLSESWWRERCTDVQVLSTRTPRIWGREHHLYRDSMNPVMSARFMRAGRMTHKSPHLDGLYLAGSSTHPGQWVSLCAISGIFAADAVHRDFGRC